MEALVRLAVPGFSLGENGEPTWHGLPARADRSIAKRVLGQDAHATKTGGSAPKLMARASSVLILAFITCNM